ncbi:MAG: DegT/DnrJ/EryC1/StrS family aminotransferase [Phycisphaerae bacterium]
MTHEYEAAFAAWLGAERAFAFWKGRVALYAILRALRVGAGDEVVVPGYTCVMDVNPVYYVGAKPIYVDIEPATFNIDPTRLAASITPRTKVILAQHTYGYPCALDDILAIAGRHGVAVVEDCCLAVGSRYRGRLVGNFGVASYFSSQWNKPYTTGIGGIAATSDANVARGIDAVVGEGCSAPRGREVAMLAAQLAAYRTLIYPVTTALATAMFRRLTRLGLVVGSSRADEFSTDMAADFFKGMGDVQARSGLRQLHGIQRNLAHRRRMARLYDDLLAELGWPARHVPDNVDPVLVRYPVRVANKQRAVSAAAGRLVELGDWFQCPLHPKDTPLEAYGYQNGMCPVAERACAEVVNLPLHPRAGERTARRTVALLASVGPAPSAA